jgi:hypothetical protein
MRKTLVLGFTTAIAAAAALLIAGPGGAAVSGCKAGMTTYGGVPARVFCGSATSTVRAAGKTFTLRTGSCQKTAGSITVDIGEIVLGISKKPKPEYFGLIVGREAVRTGPVAARDGVYHSAIVAVVHRGKGYPLRANATVVLSHGRSRGTFSATSLDGGTVTGAFAC